MASRTGQQHALVHAAKKAGWRVRTIKHGWFVYPPSGSPIAVSGSPGCVHGYANAVKQLRAAGLPIP